MAYNHYGQTSDDADRRDRNYDRDRQSARRDDDGEPGFFERAGEEIRSWFSDDDDHDRGHREREMQRAPDRNRYGESGPRNMGRGYSSAREDRYAGNRDRSRDFDRGRMDYGRAGSSYNRDRYGYGSASPGNEYGSQRSRFGREDRPSASRYGMGGEDDSGLLIYEEFSGTLGGFGNQTFASTPDDHYLSWRERQISKLDDDYREYCREREQQFHSDFDTWRSNREGQRNRSQIGSGSTTGTSGSTSGPDAGEAGSASRSAIGSERTESAGASPSGSKEPETSGAGSSRSNPRSRS